MFLGSTDYSKWERSWSWNASKTLIPSPNAREDCPRNLSSFWFSLILKLLSSFYLQPPRFTSLQETNQHSGNMHIDIWTTTGQQWRHTEAINKTWSWPSLVNSFDQVRDPYTNPYKRRLSHCSRSRYFHIAAGVDPDEEAQPYYT